MSILLDYKIQLVNKTNFGKQIFTANDDLTSCLNDFNNVDKANNLLDLTNEVINTSGMEIEFPTRSLYMLLIKTPNVNIYEDIEAWENNNSISPSYTLPISHFKIIVEAWLNFLQS